MSSVKFHCFVMIMSSSSLIIDYKMIITMAERGTKVYFKSLIWITWFTEIRTLTLPPDYQQVWESINRPCLLLHSRLSAGLWKRETLHAICLRIYLGAQPPQKKQKKIGGYALSMHLCMAELVSFVHTTNCGASELVAKFCFHGL